MLEGILFVLIIINFSITMTLYFRYSKSQMNVEDVRSEMSGMISQFNKSAERNIQILEDRIQQVKLLSTQSPATQSRAQESIAKASHVKDTLEHATHAKEDLQQDKEEKIQLAKDLLSKIKNRREPDHQQIQPQPEKKINNDWLNENYGRNESDNFKESFKEEYPETQMNNLIDRKEKQFQFESLISKHTQNSPGAPINNPNEETGYHSPILKAPSENFQERPKKKSFVQKAYSSPTPNFNPEPMPQLQKIEKQELPVEPEIDFSDENKTVIHKIAKLIGEGKTLEEISDILGISLGEIQLFTSIVRKQLSQKPSLL